MQLCTFHVAGRLLGIDVTRVQEVLRNQEMTPVPLAPPGVEGLINIRGQIVTALNLRVAMGLPPRESGADKPMNVILRGEEGPVSLLVDAIGDVVNVEPGSMEPPPENLVAEGGDLISGVCQLQDGIVLILATEKVLEPRTGPAAAVAHE